MKNYKKLIFTGILALVFGSGGLYAKYANANPSLFAKADCMTSAVSTSTVALMTPGAGTSTLACTMASSGQTAPDTATLLVFFNGSSTASVLNIGVEYSYNGTDWFADVLSERATTTPAFSMGSVQSFSWTFASSSQGQLGNANRNYISRAITLKTPTPYMRVIFSVPPGAGNGGVWAQFVGKKEI